MKLISVQEAYDTLNSPDDKFATSSAAEATDLDRRIQLSILAELKEISKQLNCIQNEVYKPSGSYVKP